MNKVAVALVSTMLAVALSSSLAAASEPVSVLQTKCRESLEVLEDIQRAEAELISGSVASIIKKAGGTRSELTETFLRHAYLYEKKGQWLVLRELYCSP